MIIRNIIFIFLFMIFMVNKIYSDQIISDISINGIKKLPNTVKVDLLTDFRSKVGFKIVEENLIYDIQSLYLSGYFQGQFEKSIKDNKVSLIFNVIENKDFQKIQFLNTSMQKKMLKSIIQSKPNSIINLKKINEDIFTINQFLKDIKGLFILLLKK